MKLFAELQRRNVFRVATAYIVVGWLVMQVIDVMAPALKLPDWIASLTAVFLLIGFPIAMLLSWVYDITPEGVVRTDAGDERYTQSTRRLDILIVAGLVLVGGLIIWQQAERRSASAAVLADSIAVLPFDDLSATGDQQYFADGLSVEILNALARSGGIAVTGRTSSFAFRDSPRTVQEIGDLLGVQTLLEGSVRKQDDRVRVVARLVNTADGVLKWTDTYESRLDDIFALQDQIAEQVRRNLSVNPQPSPAQPLYRTIAYAMYRTEDPELESVMAAWRNTLDTARAHGARSRDYDIDEARYFALLGDQDRAVELLQQAGEATRGLIGAELSYDYLNTLLEDNPTFERIMARNAERIAEEREALGI